MNGQKKRASVNIPQGFEGGQTPLHRRLPKRGFKNMCVAAFAFAFGFGWWWGYDRCWWGTNVVAVLIVPGHTSSTHDDTHEKTAGRRP